MSEYDDHGGLISTVLTRRRKVAIQIAMAETYGREVLRGIVRYAAETGTWDFQLRGGGPDDPLYDLSKWPGDGFILQAGPGSQMDQALASGLPMIQISNRDPRLDLPAVLADDVAVGRLAAEHFVNCGLRQFAFWGVPTHRYSEQREQGFSEALAGRGYSCHVCPRTIGVSRYAHSAPLREWVAGLPRPVGLLVAADNLAQPVMTAIRDLGLRVPEDVALMGVNDDPMEHALAGVALSSIDPNFDRVGYLAARLLDKLMDGEPPPGAPILVPPRGVVVRHSTEYLAIDDPAIVQALQLIRDNVKRRINVSHIVTAVGLSRRTLERRFQKALGRTPLEEIWRTRVERAKSLLATTTLSIDEVAAQSGLVSAKVMSGLFRRMVGQPPSAYRKTYHT